MKILRLWIPLFALWITLLPITTMAQGQTGATNPSQPQQPPPDCYPTAGFSKYKYADPEILMPKIEGDTVVYWNFQCSHDAVKVEVLDGSGSVIRTLHSGGYGKGDHQISWDGTDRTGQVVDDGSYKVKITPQDQFSAYASIVTVEIKQMKYPAIYGIYGDEYKEHVKQDAN